MKKEQNPNLLALLRYMIRPSALIKECFFFPFRQLTSLRARGPRELFCCTFFIIHRVVAMDAHLTQTLCIPAVGSLGGGGASEMWNHLQQIKLWNIISLTVRCAGLRPQKAVQSSVMSRKSGCVVKKPSFSYSHKYKRGVKTSQAKHNPSSVKFYGNRGTQGRKQFEEMLLDFYIHALFDTFSATVLKT